MDWKDAVKTRFVDAVRKAFPAPTPLMGEKWFAFAPDGKGAGPARKPAKTKSSLPGSRRAADFQFLGVRKLAKATGFEVGRVAQRIVKNLNFPEQLVTVEIEEGWKISVWMVQPPDGEREQNEPSNHA
jgi:hypothetical protein